MRDSHNITDSPPRLTRRDLLHSVGGGFAGVALTSLLNQEGLLAGCHWRGL